MTISGDGFAKENVDHCGRLICYWFNMWRLSGNNKESKEDDDNLYDINSNFDDDVDDHFDDDDDSNNDYCV